MTDPAMTFEQARDALIEVVARLEGGGLTLEESLALWERGESLAARCQAWLDEATVRAGAQVTGERDDAGDEEEDEDDGTGGG